MKNKFFFGILILVLVLSSGCTTSPGPPCDTQESIVDPIILSNLETSDYIKNLETEGFELTRFRGVADSCNDIPENYVHLNFKYVKDGFPYRITIQTQCNPDTLTCDFKAQEFLAQINTLESMDSISSKINSGYFQEGEVHWLFGEEDRVRYHQKELTPQPGDLDLYLVNNQIVRSN